MKRYTLILKDENGNLAPKAVFANDKKAALASEKTAVSVMAIDRIKHPSPEVLARVMTVYATTQKTVVLSEFYAACETTAKAIEMEAVETEKDKAATPLTGQPKADPKTASPTKGK